MVFVVLIPNFLDFSRISRCVRRCRDRARCAKTRAPDQMDLDDARKSAHATTIASVVETAESVAAGSPIPDSASSAAAA